MADPVVTPAQVAAADKIARELAAGDQRFNSDETRQLVRIADILECIRQEFVALRGAISGS